MPVNRPDDGELDKPLATPVTNCPRVAPARCDAPANPGCRPLTAGHARDDHRKDLSGAGGLGCVRDVTPGGGALGHGKRLAAV